MFPIDFFEMNDNEFNEIEGFSSYPDNDGIFVGYHPKTMDPMIIKQIINKYDFS